MYYPSSTEFKVESEKNAFLSQSTDLPSLPNTEEETSLRGDLDTLKLYIQEISQVPLLTAEEEVTLAKRIQAGDDKARDLMIRANLRLVVKIAHDYNHFGLPLLDLISEGNIGLMKAIERFDPEKGGKLSTYAAWWIKQTIKRALANQTKTIRLPIHLGDRIAKMRKATAALQEKLGREPLDQEIADVIGFSVAKVSYLKAIILHQTSLDAPINDEESSSLNDVIRDENTRTPFETLVDKSLSSELRQVLQRLDPREAAVLHLRFGLDGEQPKTLEEIGDSLHLTRERIRQIEGSALRQARELWLAKEKQRDQKEVHEENRQRGKLLVIQEFITQHPFERKAS